MGGTARSIRFRSRFPQTSGCRPVRRSEPQPHCHCGLCPPDQQSQMGRRSGKCCSHLTANRIAEDSVANVSQIVTVDKDFLTVRVGRLPQPKMDLLLAGVDIMLGK